jgi:hypothetical protein
MGNRDLAKKYFEAFSNKDVSGLSEMFTDDCTLRDWDNRSVGKEAVVEANKKIFDSVDTIVVEVLNLYSDGNIVVADLLITINGKDELLVVDILEFKDGKVRSVRAYKG